MGLMSFMKEAGEKLFGKGEAQAAEVKVKAAPTPAAREVMLNAFAAKVHVPYLVMAALLVVLAIWVVRSSLRS